MRQVFAYDAGKPAYAPEATIEATLRGESNEALVERFFKIGRRICSDEDDMTGCVLTALMHLCTISKGELAKLTGCSITRISMSASHHENAKSTMKILSEYVKGEYKKGLAE